METAHKGEGEWVDDLFNLRGLCCPICEEPFQDKVLQCPEGHAYCRVCWGQWLAASAGRGSCPECRTPVVLSRLVRNRQLEHLISELKQRETSLVRSNSKETKQSEATFSTTSSTCRKRKSAAIAVPAMPPHHHLSSSPPIRRIPLAVQRTPSKVRPKTILVAMMTFVMVYRLVLLSPTLIELYWNATPQFSTVIHELRSLCSTHLSNMSPPRNQTAKEALIRELLQSDTHILPMALLLGELSHHLMNFFYRLALLSFCIADTLILVSVWLTHRSAWLFFRMLVAGFQIAYRSSHYLFVDPLGPRLLHRAMNIASVLINALRNAFAALLDKMLS